MPLEIYVKNEPTTTALKSMAAISTMPGRPMPKTSNLQDSLVMATISTTPRLDHTINRFADGHGRCQQRAVRLKDKEEGEIELTSKICRKYQN